jgi:hypothetical protein
MVHEKDKISISKGTNFLLATFLLSKVKLKLNVAQFTAKLFLFSGKNTISKSKIEEKSFKK